MSEQNQQKKVILTNLGASETYLVKEGCVTLSVVALTGTATITELEGNTSHAFVSSDDVLGEELPVLTGNDRYKTFSIVTSAASSAKVTEVR